jgi:hypothetical protein
MGVLGVIITPALLLLPPSSFHTNLHQSILLFCDLRVKTIGWPRGRLLVLHQPDVEVTRSGESTCKVRSNVSIVID